MNSQNPASNGNSGGGGGRAPSPGGPTAPVTMSCPGAGDPVLDECHALLEATHKKLWLAFQQTAASVTKLYRDGLQQSQSPSDIPGAGPDPLWQAFQVSAGNLTQFYKETIEAINAVQEKAVLYGYQKRRREVATIRAAAIARHKKAQQHQSHRLVSSCGQQVNNVNANVNNPGSIVDLPSFANLHSSTQQQQTQQQQQQQQSDAAALALELELEKTVLHDELSLSPIRSLKRKPPPSDDILESIFIKRAKPS